MERTNNPLCEVGGGGILLPEHKMRHRLRKEQVNDNAYTYFMVERFCRYR